MLFARSKEKMKTILGKFNSYTLTVLEILTAVTSPLSPENCKKALMNMIKVVQYSFLKRGKGKFDENLHANISKEK